jgi:hypothetical protein
MVAAQMLLMLASMAAPAAAASKRPQDSLRNSLLVLLVSSIGNILEWFDFAIFGYFADVTTQATSGYLYV